MKHLIAIVRAAAVSVIAGCGAMLIQALLWSALVFWRQDDKTVVLLVVAGIAFVAWWAASACALRMVVRDPERRGGVARWALLGLAAFVLYAPSALPDRLVSIYVRTPYADAELAGALFGAVVAMAAWLRLGRTDSAALASGGLRALSIFARAAQWVLLISGVVIVWRGVQALAFALALSRTLGDHAWEHSGRDTFIALLGAALILASLVMRWLSMWAKRGGAGRQRDEVVIARTEPHL